MSFRVIITGEQAPAISREMRQSVQRSGSRKQHGAFLNQQAVPYTGHNKNVTWYTLEEEHPSAKDAAFCVLKVTLDFIFSEKWRNTKEWELGEN